MNGPEPVKSEICVFGSVSATRFGIMNGTFDDGLPSAKMSRPVCSLSLIVKVLASPTVIAVDEGHHLLAERVLRGPALDRGDAVLGRDRRTVVPGQSVAQRERIGELVRRNVVLVDHLRLDLALLVHREERVVDHVAVIAGDVGGGPDRVDDLEVGMHHHLQGGLRICAARQCKHGGGCGNLPGLPHDRISPDAGWALARCYRGTQG